MKAVRSHFHSRYTQTRNCSACTTQKLVAKELRYPWVKISLSLRDSRLLKPLSIRVFPSGVCRDFKWTFSSTSGTENMTGDNSTADTGIHRRSPSLQFTSMEVSNNWNMSKNGVDSTFCCCWMLQPMTETDFNTVDEVKKVRNPILSWFLK